MSLVRLAVLESSKAVKTMEYAKKRLEAQIIQNCEKMGFLIELVTRTCKNLGIDLELESNMDKVEIILPKMLIEIESNYLKL